MNRIDSDTYELSTGRRIQANRGILGLTPDKLRPHESRLTEGYDGPVWEGAQQRGPADDPGDILTPAERLEIAEHQIKLWGDWAGLHSAEEKTT